MLNDEISEILVVREEDTLLAMSDRENLLVGQSSRIITPDARCVMTAVIEEDSYTGFNILIEEKLHAPLS